MSMRGRPLRPSTFSKVMVCVNDIVNKEAIGTLHSMVNPEGIKFAGIIEMCDEMEKLFNNYNFPQSTSAMRSFRASRSNKRTVVEKEVEYVRIENLDTQGAKATFIIHVQFRQNASWQGTIQWVDGKKTQRFRSTLEMIKLISDALPEEEEDMLSWDDVE